MPGCGGACPSCGFITRSSCDHLLSGMLLRTAIVSGMTKRVMVFRFVLLFLVWRNNWHEGMIESVCGKQRISLTMGSSQSDLHERKSTADKMHLLAPNFKGIKEDADSCWISLPGNLDIAVSSAFSSQIPTP